MDFSTFQALAAETAIYPRKYAIMYPAMGLSGEVGEVLNKVKKVYRDDNGYLTQEMEEDLAKEIGDVFWYLAALCSDLDISMEAAALGNLQKLLDRKERGVIQGSGDDR